MVADFYAASSAKSKWKNAMKLLSVFGIGFNPSKCKTMAKMTVARIKLLRNKRHAVVGQMRRDIALLLQSGQDATARIRVEHVMREQNIMAANEILELFCELVVARMSIISKNRQCPDDLKEGISSLIFAAPRCSDIPELQVMRGIFEKKYGKDFVSAATDLRPSCGVNRLLIDKLSVRPPTGEMKLKIMKEIAKEHQVAWDYSESETELLKPPEELIQGSNAFVSASSMPVKPNEALPSQTECNNTTSQLGDGGRGRRNSNTQFDNSEAAAEAAAEAAKKAIAAAEAAAYLASKEQSDANRQQTFYSSSDVNLPKSDLQSGFLRNTFHSQSLRSDHQQPFTPGDNNAKSPDSIDERNVSRRHSHNNPGAYSDIKFDDSGSEDESKMKEDYHPYHHGSNFNCAPSCPPPSVPPPSHSLRSDHQQPFTPGDNNAKSPNSIDERNVSRRHSHNNPGAYSDIKFDDSGSEDESKMKEDYHRYHHGSTFNSAPSCPPPSVPPPSDPLIPNNPTQLLTLTRICLTMIHLQHALRHLSTRASDESQDYITPCPVWFCFDNCNEMLQTLLFPVNKICCLTRKMSVDRLV